MLSNRLERLPLADRDLSRAAAIGQKRSVSIRRFDDSNKHYPIHRIDNSPWLAEFEQRNAIHPRHD